MPELLMPQVVREQELEMKPSVPRVRENEPEMESETPFSETDVEQEDRASCVVPDRSSYGLAILETAHVQVTCLG